MTLICVEPVILAGKISSFTSFTDTGQFKFHHFSKSNEDLIDSYFEKQKHSCFCFNVFKVFPTFGDRLAFIWDVKILYELLGYKFDGLIALSRLILGINRTQKYENLSSKVNAHIRSFQVVKIDSSAYEVLELLPHDLVQELYIERSNIIKDLYFNVSEEDKVFYVKFYDSIKFLFKLSCEPLNIDLSVIENDVSHYSSTIRRCTKDNKLFLKFRAVGAKTGRLGFEKNSVNLYTLPRELRRCIIASEGFKFVEFDFKSSQPRIAIFSTENREFMDLMKQTDDVYSIFPGNREENKQSFLAWMFSKTRIPGNIFEQYAWPIWELRNQLSIKSESQGFLETRWGRRLYNHGDPKNVIFQNFITATEVDCILKLSEKLKEEGLDVKLLFHDAIIAELEDLTLISKYKEICESFSESVFGARFPVGVKVGDNLAQMNAV